MAPQNRDGGFQELPRTGGWDVPFARPPPFPRATVPAAAAGQQRCAWEEAAHRAAADHGSPGPLTRTGTSAGLPALGLLTKREKKPLSNLSHCIGSRSYLQANLTLTDKRLSGDKTKTFQERQDM